MPLEVLLGKAPRMHRSAVREQELGDDFDGLLECALAENPAGRFADAASMAEALDAALAAWQRRMDGVCAAAPESLAVLFNPTRNEAYVTHRKAGEVSVIDGKSYKVVKTFKTPTHPNSLALSDDGKTLYVSVKQASSRQKEATAPDDVIRIAL